MTRETETTEPKGVVAMLSSPEGHVTAEHSFDKGSAAGFKQHEMQKMRARDRLYRAFMDAYCSPVISKATDEFERKKIVDTLVRDHGWKLYFHYVGYNDEELGQA